MHRSVTVLTALLLFSMTNAAAADLALTPVNATIEKTTYKGRPAWRLVPGKGEGDQMLAIAGGSTLAEGTIEVMVAGAPREGAPPDSRGFIGIAFHVDTDASHFECFYLRPTNGRADDQLRRNHSLQYVSHPDHPWHALRKSDPGRYESYADLEAGVWTRMKIVIKGRTARLFIGDATQPALIVNDLKLGERGGKVAFWAHTSTDAYFADLRVKP